MTMRSARGTFNRNDIFNIYDTWLSTLRLYTLYMYLWNMYMYIFDQNPINLE